MPMHPILGETDRLSENQNPIFPATKLETFFAEKEERSSGNQAHVFPTADPDSFIGKKWIEDPESEGTPALEKTSTRAPAVLPVRSPKTRREKVSALLRALANLIER